MKLSRMVYGTWRLLEDDDASLASPQAINRRLHLCVENGITTIDTAEIYGLYEVEEALGKALALSPGLRGQLQLVSKCGIYVPCQYHPERKVAFYHATADRVKKSAEKSLRLLGTDHLDLLLIHRPDWLTSADDTAAGLNQLLKEGKITHAGVSNYNVHQFDLLNSRMDQPLAVNQIEFHLLHQLPIHDGTLSQCERLGVLPMAWSPLAGGRLMNLDDVAAQRVRQVVSRISSHYNGVSLEQLAYAWILAHPSRPSVVMGSNKEERIKAAARSTELILQREDWYAMAEAGNGFPVP